MIAITGCAEQLQEVGNVTTARYPRKNNGRITNKVAIVAAITDSKFKSLFFNFC